MEPTHYDLLAGMLEHPAPGFAEGLEHLEAALAKGHPAAQAALLRFRGGLPTDDLHAMEELYSRTFEVQAITTLDIGYVLFGEDYKRGELLANLSREHRTAGNDCTTELADHLTNVLRLLPLLEDDELRRELVTVLIAPAIKKMLRDFAPKQMAERDVLYRKHHKTIIDSDASTRTLYEAALETVSEVLRADFSLDDAELDEPASEFVRAVGTEMTVESCASRTGDS